MIWLSAIGIIISLLAIVVAVWGYKRHGADI